MSPALTEIPGGAMSEHFPGQDRHYKQELMHVWWDDIPKLPVTDCETVQDVDYVMALQSRDYQLWHDRCFF